MIPQLLREWEQGFAMVLCIKRTSEESPLMFWLRTRYYRLNERLSSIDTIQNFTGFGLFDRRVMNIARSFGDPYPFFRGLLAEIGLPAKKLHYDQPGRRRGAGSAGWFRRRLDRGALVRLRRCGGPADARVAVDPSDLLAPRALA